MNAHENPESEISAISIKGFPGVSKDELLKKQAILFGLAILVILACTAILKAG